MEDTNEKHEGISGKRISEIPKPVYGGDGQTVQETSISGLGAFIYDGN